MRAIILMSGLCVASSLAVADHAPLGDSTAVSRWETTAFHAIAPASGDQTAGWAACPGGIWDHAARLHVAGGVIAVARGCLCGEERSADE